MAEQPLALCARELSRGTKTTASSGAKLPEMAMPGPLEAGMTTPGAISNRTLVSVF